MSKTLIMLPVSLRDDQDRLSAHLPLMETLGAGDRQTFFYGEDNALELKDLLLGSSFDTIIIGFPSLDMEFPEIQIVKSIAFRSSLVLYCPDLRFVRAGRKNSRSGDCDLFQWYALGKSIQLDSCRQADLVVLEADSDRDLLSGEADGTPLMTVEELKAGAPAVQRKKSKKVSIIILTFNQLEDTRQCVESLVKHTAGVDYELIFVDNGSADGTRAYLEELKASDPDVQVIYNETNLGFAKANNQGAKLATGEYLLLLNNDVILTEGWLDRLLACAESDPDIGSVGPVTNHAVGEQVVGRDLPLDDAEIQKFACMQMMNNAGYWFETHRIIGFCLLVKRAVVERIGLLDERFGPGGFEDYDFCLRVRQAGYKIMIASDTFIYHIGGRGYTKNNLDYDKLRHQNVQIFIDKWCEKALKILEVM